MNTLSSIIAIAVVAAPGAAFAGQSATGQPGSARPRPAAGLEMVTGVEHQRGRYGTGKQVRTTSIPTTVNVAAGRALFAATLPHVRVDAPGNVVGGGGLLGLPILIDPGRPAQRIRREGVGDLRLRASYAVPTPGFGLAVSGQVKVPTASERNGLGTGKADYGVGAEVSKQLGRVTPFASLGYTVPGDPEGYDLRNSLSARAGAAVQIGAKTRGHLSYGYAQSVSPLVPDEQQIATGINTGLSKNLSLGVYGSAGLSRGAPGVGAGVQIGFKVP